MKVNVVDEGLTEIICGPKFDEKEEKQRGDWNGERWTDGMGKGASFYLAPRRQAFQCSRTHARTHARA